MIGSYSTFGEQRRRRRRQVRWSIVRFLFGLAAVAIVGGYGYQVGVSADQAWTDKLEADLQRFQEDNLALRDQLAMTALHASAARTALEDLQRRYRAKVRDGALAALEDLQRRYRARVPDGALAGLLGRVERQLQAGVDQARLAFLIDAAGQDAGCPQPPVTKRFTPRTPLGIGPVGAVRFDDRITVTADAESALDEQGQPEAWYDPAKPVRLAFRTLDGRELAVEGTLPLRHSVLVDGAEYRFSAIPGPTSFVEITGQACPFP
jgi:cell division protein FtsB